jgi:hypothetical protein
VWDIRKLDAAITALDTVDGADVAVTEGSAMIFALRRRHPHLEVDRSACISASATASVCEYVKLRAPRNSTRAVMSWCSMQQAS